MAFFVEKAGILNDETAMSVRLGLILRSDKQNKNNNNGCGADSGAVAPYCGFPSLKGLSLSISSFTFEAEDAMVFLIKMTEVDS